MLIRGACSTKLYIPSICINYKFVTINATITVLLNYKNIVIVCVWFSTVEVSHRETQVHIWAFFIRERGWKLPFLILKKRVFPATSEIWIHVLVLIIKYLSQQKCTGIPKQKQCCLKFAASECKGKDADDMHKTDTEVS